MSKAEFDKLLNQSTSSGNLEPDWASIMTLCDLLKRRDKNMVSAKGAVALIKQKILDKNETVSLYGLLVLEACMKNCGSRIHQEVCERHFLNDLRDLSRGGCSRPIKEKIIELIGSWNHALQSDSRYRIVQETYNAMKGEGIHFPPVTESEAFLDADTAPDWVPDTEVSSCHMCRAPFGLSTRKHHCRNCGQVFCARCSGKKAAIPQYGFEEDVRVCDMCFKKLTLRAVGGAVSHEAGGDSELPREYLTSSLFRESQGPPQRNEEEEKKQQEEEELQMALALSLSEEEAAKSKQKQPAAADNRPSAPQPVATNPEMARYEDRAYWERRRAEQQQLDNEYELPTIVAPPAAAAAAMTVVNPSSPEARHMGIVEEAGDDYQTLVDSLQRTIGLFTTRMQQVSGSGRSVALDSSVQSLFHSLNAMHPQLLSQIENQEQSKDHYEGIDKKLRGVKEARTSLNKMRRQNREKQQQLEEERMMLERLQMQQKIELLRQQRREEENHQEMLRQKRQRIIEDQQKAQEDELQRRMLQHQQRQMELHLSVQAEQQNKLRQYHGFEAGEVPVYSQDYAPMTSHYQPSQPYSLPPQPVSQYQYAPSASFAPEQQVTSYGQVMGQPEPQLFSSLASMEPSQLHGYSTVKELPPSVGSMQPQSIHEPANITASLQSLQLAPQPQLQPQPQVYGGHQPMQSVQSGQPVHSAQSMQVLPPSLSSQPAPQMNLPQSMQPSLHPPNPASEQVPYQLPPAGGYIPTQGPPIHQQAIDPTQSLQPASFTFVPGQSPPMQRRPIEDQFQPGRSYISGYSQLPGDVVRDQIPPMLPSTGHQGYMYAPPQPTKPEVQLISFE